MNARVASALFAFAIGCASSSSPSGGPTGSGSVDNCSCDGLLSGGVTGSIVANGCASSGGGTFSVVQADLISGRSLGIRFDLVTPLKGGEIGPQPLKKIVVFERTGKDAPQLEWEGTACVLELTKNESKPTSVFENRFLLGGKANCPSGLTPAKGNTKPSVEITPFTFEAFINPS